MTFDYSGVQDIAIELVERFGRPVVFVKLGTVPDNPGEPWKGTTTSRTTPQDEVSGFAVSVPPSSASELGISSSTVDFVKSCEQILIAVPGVINSDLSDFNEVRDGDDVFVIEGVEKLQPANDIILYFMGIRR